VRRELLPLLQGYNPAIAESLLRLSRTACDEQAFLDAEAARVWQKIVQKEGDTIIFDKKRFKNTPPSLQRRLLRMAIDCLLGSLKDIEAATSRRS
jgi:tRNA(Ile)-lysidine synthase